MALAPGRGPVRLPLRDPLEHVRQPMGGGRVPGDPEAAVGPSRRPGSSWSSATAARTPTATRPMFPWPTSTGPTCSSPGGTAARTSRPSTAGPFASWSSPPLRLEELQVGPRSHLHGRGPRRLLGAARLPHVRRSFPRGALLRVGPAVVLAFPLTCREAGRDDLVDLGTARVGPAGRRSWPRRAASSPSSSGWARSWWACWPGWAGSGARPSSGCSSPCSPSWGCCRLPPPAHAGAEARPPDEGRGQHPGERTRSSWRRSRRGGRARPSCGAPPGRRAQTVRETLAKGRRCRVERVEGLTLWLKA